ncbi:MAG: restriction endonuclease subunit S, partial [Deltaproteobacteria bacterium]|nr:restriction endonuclease subunit S [Deltaproteobacteria bacterium]
MKAWSEMRLGKLVKIKHGFAFKGEHFNDRGDYILLTPGNLYPKGGLKLKGEKETYYTGDFPRAYILAKGDLVIVMTDLTQDASILGGAMLIDRSDLYLHNQRLGLVSHTDEIDRRFLYQYFNWQFFRDQVKASSNGATVKHTSPGRIYQCRICRPPLPTQRKIAAILSAYDELIENNKRRIALLEKLAEQIYREWFVRLRFPGHQGVELVKGVPSGWGVRPLGSFASEIKQGIRKKDLADDERYLGLEHIPRRSIAIREWATADTVDSNKLLFQARDILVGKIRPYLHKVALAHFAGACSSDTIVLRPKQKIYEGYLLFTVFSDTFIELATVASKGTKMPRADWGFLKKLELAVPDEKLLERYQAQFDALF